MLSVAFGIPFWNSDTLRQHFLYFFLIQFFLLFFLRLLFKFH